MSVSDQDGFCRLCKLMIWVDATPDQVGHEDHAWHEHDCDYQDLLDGAALRRLREALPDGYEATLSLGDHPYMHAVAIVVDNQDPTHLPDYWGGATIAEAADKCREALG